MVELDSTGSLAATSHCCSRGGGAAFEEPTEHRTNSYMNEQMSIECENCRRDTENMEGLWTRIHSITGNGKGFREGDLGRKWGRKHGLSWGLKGE